MWLCVGAAMRSSQWVSLAGVTVVSVLQLLYHAGPRWRHHFTRRAHVAAPWREWPVARP